jgi:hypothetical protein
VVDQTALGVQRDDLPNLADDGPAQDAARAAQTFLVVAKGHGDLIDQLREVVGDLGWVQLIKDRRDDPTILPREGRQGSVHIDPDLSP